MRIIMCHELTQTSAGATKLETIDIALFEGGVTTITLFALGSPAAMTAGYLYGAALISAGTYMLYYGNNIDFDRHPQ